MIERNDKSILFSIFSPLDYNFAAVFRISKSEIEWNLSFRDMWRDSMCSDSNIKQLFSLLVLTGVVRKTINNFTFHHMLYYVFHVFVRIKFCWWGNCIKPMQCREIPTFRSSLQDTDTDGLFYAIWTLQRGSVCGANTYKYIVKSRF